MTTEGGYICTIPFVNEEMPNLNPLEPVQFHYIPDFVKSYTFDGINDKPAEINTEDLSNGIYFYSLNTGYGRITKKMIVR
jgi:hypothetical protein